MWIFTDAANWLDEHFRDNVQNYAVDATSPIGFLAAKESDGFLVANAKIYGRNASPLVAPVAYVGAEYASQQYDAIRFGDGMTTGTISGFVQDLFRGLSVIGGGLGIAGKATSIGGKFVAQAGKISNSQRVIKAQEAFAGRLGAMLGRAIPMTVRSGKVYTNLAAVFHSRGISTLRYEVSGRVTDLVTMLKQAQIIKYFKHSTINPDVSDLGRIIGQNGSLFLRMNVLTPSHRFVRECVVFRDVRGRAMIKGEYGTYSSFKEYRLNEFSTGQDVKFVKLTDILESNVVRDIRFDFSKHRKLIGSLVELEGVVLQNFDPMKIVEEYQKENPYID